MLDRHAFRAHALDGAALFFQPATGVHVRVATTATRGWRRRAPRVAMFGITNACNLACAYCSRDPARDSAWTVESAAALLRGLADAGTLEVAYGGGEPFAFRGFAELVAELDSTTTLAQHVTTNGTLIDRARFAPFAGRFGQVRVSIHAQTPWRAAAEVLGEAGQRWGANLLIDGRALPGLPALLDELATHGAHDVSLLSYVGPDPARHLDAEGDRRLAAIVADSPLPCRLSVCFGDRIAVPRLFTGDDRSDCGAGRDFVTITPDRRVQACSFQDRGLPATNAAEVLEIWRARDAALAMPSSRSGCARVLPLAKGRSAPPPIAVWQAFSGNNSGECFLVAKFEEVADAEAYLADLLPTWTPNGPYPPEWRKLFADERVLGSDILESFEYDEDASPREMVAIGRTVIAVQYAAEDAFPELRALAWKRGAAVTPGGIHVHDGATLLAAVRVRDDTDSRHLAASDHLAGARYHRHGDVVLAVMPLFRGHELTELPALERMLLAWADGRPLAIEIVFADIDDDELVDAKKRLGRPSEPQLRLTVGWWGSEATSSAERFAELAPGRATIAGGKVLVDPAPDRKRLGLLGWRRGAYSVRALDEKRVRVDALLWYEPPVPRRGAKAEARTLDRAELERFASELTEGEDAQVRWPDPASFWERPKITVVTEDPGPVVAAIAGYAAARDAQISVHLEDADRVGAALRRLVGGLGRRAPDR
jgi:MoaA/NifB/PqqE/SkfB family radical SAM enzyme